MCLTSLLKSVMLYGSETGNDKEWAQNNEENIHFKLFDMLIDMLPWGYTAFLWR